MMSIYEKIGHRIKMLREKTGMSQNMLSQKMDISRPAVSQIESGERKISADELQKLSHVFRVSVDDLLNPVKEPEVHLHKGKEWKTAKPKMRISVPQKNLEKFKEVLLYILNKVGSKPNIGETVLYKLLYFIDFDFYEKHEEQLIGATYIKNKFGPTPVEFLKIVKKMEDDKELVKVKNKYFQYDQTKYLPRRSPDLNKLSALELAHVDEVLNRLSDKTAKELSDYSHSDTPWQVHQPGEIISYESVFYRDQEHSVK